MKKVVIADDEVFIRKIIGTCLRSADIQVIEAEDGREAIEKVLAERPSLIIMDVMMPKMDGFQACEAIRSSPEVSNTPIIMLTARGQMMDMKRAMNLGIVEYMTKPFSPKLLKAKVLEILMRR